MTWQYSRQYKAGEKQATQECLKKGFKQRNMDGGLQEQLAWRKVPYGNTRQSGTCFARQVNQITIT